MIRRQALSRLSALLLTSGCAKSQLGEASCSLDLKDFPKLLHSIRPLIESGFGEPEIQGLVRLAESTAVNETRSRALSITYKRKETRLRLELKKDDVDTLEVWFFAEPELSTQILNKMKEVLR